jgi:hypothetical protein
VIVETQAGLVALTDHAVERYRERVNPRASIEDVARALQDAVFVRRSAVPAWVTTKTGQAADDTAGAFVGPGFAFAARDAHLHRDRGVAFVAPTCLRKPRRPKAQVRAWREERRAEEWAA